jgi:hypothetical protein
MGTHRRYGRRDSLALARIIQDRQEVREEQARRLAAEEDLDPCEVDTTPTEHEQRVVEDLAPLLQASLEQIEKQTTGRNAPHVLGGWMDPSCRFATHPSHRCHRNDGQPIGPSGDCFAEARLWAVSNAGIIVRCEDGMVRHDQPFATRAEADAFAEWGHICTRQHTFEPALVAS